MAGSRAARGVPALSPTPARQSRAMAAAAAPPGPSDRSTTVRPMLGRFVAVGALEQCHWPDVELNAQVGGKVSNSTRGSAASSMRTAVTALACVRAVSAPPGPSDHSAPQPLEHHLWCRRCLLPSPSPPPPSPCRRRLRRCLRRRLRRRPLRRARLRKDSLRDSLRRPRLPPPASAKHYSLAQCVRARPAPATR